MNDHIGRKLGNYQLVRKLGQGGYGEVYIAEHVHLKTQAAIKLLQHVQLPSEAEENFRKEAATIAKLDHPHIIRVFDYGIQDSTSTPYLVMDYAPNGTVRQRYQRGKILEPLHISSYVKQVAGALGSEHPDVAQSFHGLAEIYYRKWKKFEQAESLFQGAIAIYEKAQLLDHPELAQILRTYAILLSVLNRKTEAAEILERVKAIRAKHANN